MPEISSHLEQIYHNSLLINYYLVHFKEFIIIILHKNGSKKDFTSLKSYQLISLLNTVKKIIKIVLVAKICYMVITNNLLSKIYFGGWCRSYIETAIYYLIKKIDIAWNKNKIASLLIIDIFITYSKLIFGT